LHEITNNANNLNHDMPLKTAVLVLEQQDENKTLNNVQQPQLNHASDQETKYSAFE